MGVDANIEISDYKIETDDSIWPYANMVEDDGFFCDEKMVAHYYPLINEDISYVYFSIIKSSQTFNYNREVQKISSVFSYIGGIIGAILTALFIMNNYTSFAFEVSIASEIFEAEQKKNDE